MKRADPYVNNFNIWLTLALKCNHDLKMFVVQLLDTLSIIFYLSWYSTKPGMSSYNIVELAEIALKNLNKFDKCNSIEEKSTKFVLKCYNAMVNHTEYSGAQIGAMLLNIGRNGTFYSSHLTEPMFIYQFIHDLDTEHSNENDYVNIIDFAAKAKYNTYDYIHRPLELENYCLFQFISEFKRFRFVNSKNDYLKFIDSHEQHKTFCVKKNSIVLVPKYIGPPIPHYLSDDLNEQIMYSKIMLILFKPFRDIYEFKTNKEKLISNFLEYKEFLILHNNSYIIQKLHNMKEMKRGLDDAAAQQRTKKTEDKKSKIIRLDDIYSSSDEDQDLDYDEIAHLVNDIKLKELDNLITNKTSDQYTINEQENIYLFKTFNPTFDYTKNWNNQIKKFNIKNGESLDDDFGNNQEPMPEYDSKVLSEFFNSPVSDISGFIIKKFNLNFEQQIAFDLFCEKFVAASLKQKIINVSGSGGCGKSEIIKAIQHYFFLNMASDQLLSAAYTGGAANTINGEYVFCI